MEDSHRYIRKNQNELSNSGITKCSMQAKNKSDGQSENSISRYRDVIQAHRTFQ